MPPSWSDPANFGHEKAECEAATSIRLVNFSSFLPDVSSVSNHQCLLPNNLKVIATGET
jgi:hypothetical protein